MAIQEYLKVFRCGVQLGDRYEEALTLDSMGTIECSLDEMQKALDYFHQALPVWRAVSNPLAKGTRKATLVLFTPLWVRSRRHWTITNRPCLCYTPQMTARIMRPIICAKQHWCCLPTILGRSRRRWITTTRPCHWMRADGRPQRRGDYAEQHGFHLRRSREKQKALEYYNHALPSIAHWATARARRPP